MSAIIYLFVILCVVNIPGIRAQNRDSLQADGSNLPFRAGEDLTFKIRYGFIRAGTAHMRILGRETYKGIPAIHIQTVAASARAFNWIYKVHDVVNVMVRATDLLPLYFEKKLREGTYKADLFVRYDRSDSLALVEFIRYKKDMSVRKHEKYPIKIPANVFDVLSAFYYIRTQPLVVGKSFYITSHERKKIYDLEIKVYKKEIISTDAGKFRCLAIEPLLKGEGIFKQKGRLKIWLTDDRYKIPVQMTSAVAVGHITTELTKMAGVPEYIPARIK